MSDWSSYDDIARHYDEVWGRHFESVARHIWGLIPLAAGAAVLDVGTGTAIVPRALGARVHELAGVIGCDRSAAMLSKARARMPALRGVVADFMDLPFAPAVFDVATASFVPSHLPSYKAGLVEAYRVLKPAGIFAMTSWMANTDPYSEAWGRLLAEAVSQDRLDEAAAQVVPFEGYFQRAENVEAALMEAGFSSVEVHTVALECSFSVDLYLADRALSLRGRFARHVLGAEGWGRFIGNAREQLGRSFGSHFGFSRGVLIGLGRRA